MMNYERPGRPSLSQLAARNGELACRLFFYLGIQFICMKSSVFLSGGLPCLMIMIILYASSAFGVRSDFILESMYKVLYFNSYSPNVVKPRPKL